MTCCHWIFGLVAQIRPSATLGRDAMDSCRYVARLVKYSNLGFLQTLNALIESSDTVLAAGTAVACQWFYRLMLGKGFSGHGCGALGRIGSGCHDIVWNLPCVVLVPVKGISTPRCTLWPWALGLSLLRTVK